ncbi:MAG: cation diffusion facilitator family transporter [Alphaproteobacteria bacterium]|jgi:ferrous-iron efflux pump FieF|nr:cation diffusion facilitator family transporter [Alphaproteobacteria bacterium]MDP6817950.1 cation diffusion facilitator family transporter [Alphaproteobacteria bacterium]
MTTGTVSRDRAERLMRRATSAAVSVALLLIAVKLAAWLITDSVSLLSSLADSVMDALASLVNLLAVRHALQPADPEHRFGHGKAEPLAGLGQAAFICASGIYLIVEAVGRLLEPRDIVHGEFGVGVMVFSIAVTAALVAYQRAVIKRTDSLAIRADSLHYATDILVNGGVILSLLLVMFLDWRAADPIVALLIAGFIIFSAGRIARSSLNHLMDRELPDGERERIKQIALKHPAVIDCHDLKTRAAGLNSFIQLHISMDGGLTLDAAHEISDAVEAAIMAAFPNAEVIIHADPEGVLERRQEF